MRIPQHSIIILILIVLTCSQFSCDLPENESVLYLILRKLKFRVTEISEKYSSHLKRYDVLFLQDLKKAPSATEIQNIQDFVRSGGTLIVCGGNHQAMEGLVASYGLKSRNLSNRLELSQRFSDKPFFPLHPVDEIRSRTYFIIDTFQRDAAVLYSTENQGVVVTLRHGKGRVFFATSAHLFSENGLHNSRNATLLFNLMSTLPRNAHIGLFEGEYYIQKSSNRSNSQMNFIFNTPGGLSAVYICLIIFAFLALRGRRFGKPLDVRENNRRLSSEYVHAMTSLYQKGNTRMEILSHIRDKFKADLGIRWRVNPNLNTANFIEELENRGATDEDRTLTKLLFDLGPSDNISEAQLVELAKRVEAYRATAKIRRTK